MNILIIYSHPNPNSFNHAILETAKETFQKQGHTVIVRDLYAMEFDPVLKPADFELIQQGKVSQDVKTEQEFISNSDLIVMIYPIWWATMGAMLKGYIDRVFSHGFAYRYTQNGPEGLLNSKKVIIINTMGTPNTSYESMGMLDAMALTTDTGIYKFCGMEIKNHIFLGAIPASTPEQRAAHLQNISTLLG
ncbi:MAG: NAD(P)H-dependent oxidoreductase [Deltaproteobacteria bacterium]|nr:NAD(P)H-dependent oxidoreductase [Deltaproteobacteria bacterium]